MKIAQSLLAIYLGLGLSIKKWNEFSEKHIINNKNFTEGKDYIINIDEKGHKDFEANLICASYVGIKMNIELMKRKGRKSLFINEVDLSK